ncbi:MAG: hypothetical protein HY913_09845 [Desulfomonile tiedjei]|nr:hypothetical protein [Desulfomonile tiedjei]
MPRKQQVTLSLEADTAFLKLATSFVENSAGAFGMDHSGALALTLATEEIFAYLCTVGVPRQELEIRCFGGLYYVKVQFFFEAQDFNMRSFNLTATASVQDETSFQETGLLIASRMVDRFDFFVGESNKHLLTLTKDKDYPVIATDDLPKIQGLVHFKLRTPDTEEVKLFVSLVHRQYAGMILPPFFSFPGKVADMVASGEYRASIASDERGQIGGGILWHMARQTVAECYGPYVLGPKSETRTEMAASLVDRCIENLARTEVVGLTNRFPTQDLPEGYFQKLGILRYRTEDRGTRELPIFYRELLEDAGTAVWCHPELEAFLKGEFERLFLAREIRLVRSQGEATQAYSVLSAEFDRPNKQVTLNPVLSGTDSEDNLARHVEILTNEGLTNVLFPLDLGEPWQMEFVPALLKNDFEPRLVLPYAGNRDLVVFQLKTGDLPG